jgi:membrane-associated protein
MDYVKYLIDFILHIDVHLSELIRDYGVQTYAILFAIVFVETGLVIMPFLPGDSLLFAAGAFAAKGDFNVIWLGLGLTIAAIVGDSLNYAIGHYFGPKVFVKEYRWLNRSHLRRTEEFYEKHGGKTIILARFVPIIRTFAPFVAGVGAMNYRRFLLYNVVGAIAWVWSFLLLGFFFGNLPAVKENFTLVIFAIIIISVLPILYEFMRARFASSPASQ